MTGREWTAKVETLPKYDVKGNEIVYTATESTTGSKFYTKVSESGLTVTNKFEVPEDTTPITVKKVWEDNNNKIWERPSKVTFTVKGNDGTKEVTETVDVTGDMTGRDWTATVNLPKYDAKGNEIVYTATESTTGSTYYVKESESGLTVTNKIDYSKFTETIKVVKSWDEDGRKDVERPEKVAIELNNGNEISNKELLKSNGWTDTYTVPKYDENGNPYAYTVSEKNVEKYVLTSTEAVTGKDGIITITLTNTLPKLTIEKDVVSIIKDGKEEIVEGVAGENIEVTPGTIVKYRIKVTNGKIALKDVKIVDEMANKKDIYTTYNAETKKLSNKVTDGVVRTIESLAANAVVDEENPIYVYYEVDEKDTENTKLNSTIENTASVTGKYEDNSEKTVELPPVEDDAFVTVKEDTKLKVEKHQYIGKKKLNDKEEDVKVKPGTVITYEILVTNLGNVDQKEIAISDVMKLNNETRDDLKVEDMTIDSKHELKNGKITLLEIGDTATITAKYEVQEKDMADESQTIKNTATARNESDDVTVKTEEYKSKVTVTKKGTVKDGETGKTTEITNAAEAMKVKYGDEITYRIVVSNEGLKPGSAKIWDTILKDMKDDVELVGSIKVVDSKGTTLKTLNAEDRNLLETETSTGYQITDVEEGNDVSLVFTIKIKAYAGTLLSNVAKYQTNGDKTPTNPVTVDVEDTAYVVSTSTVKVDIPQKAILVLDFSTSMNEAANGNPVSYWNPSKLSTLKSAVNNFLTDYFKANKDNEVMIITYGASATKVCSYTKSASTAYGTIQYKTIPQNEGTNMVAGLRMAYDNISKTDAKNTSVILMTDGIPGYRYDEKTDSYVKVKDAYGRSGFIYMDAAGDSTKEAAKLITDGGSKLFTIGFGLDDKDAKKMLKDCATPDTDTVKYYHEALDDEALEAAFKDIATSVTTDSKPVDKETEEGVLIIDEGFKEGQNVEIYIDYDAENPPESKDAWKIYTWNEFKNLNNGKTGNEKINYTTIETEKGKQVLKFKFGQFLKDNEDKSKGIGPDTELTFRFVNPKTN